MAKSRTAERIGIGLYVLGLLLSILLFLAGALLSFVRLVEPEGSLFEAVGFTVLALAPSLGLWGVVRLVRFLVRRP